MKLLISTVALLSTTAMAADLKFNAEGRFDYVNGKIKHDQVTSTNNYEEKTAGFYSNVLRLNAVATINENLSFRMRYRFSTNTTTANRDLTFDNLDFFYLDHKTSMFTVRLGKQANLEMNGREFFMSGSDFPVTLGSAGYTTANTAVYNTTKSDLGLYRVGASMIFNQLEGNTFTLNASDVKTAAVDTAGAGNNSKNTSLTYGAYYNGSFFNKMFQPTLGYTMAKIDPEVNAANTAANTTEATYNLLAVGARSEVAGFVIDADWKQYKRPNHAVVGATSNEDKTSSIWANVAYTWDNLTPFANYIHDKYDVSVSDTSDYKRDALTLGLQIKPFKENNFRYHVAYTNDVKKIDAAASGDKKVTANVVAAGIKFDL